MDEPVATDLVASAYADKVKVAIIVLETHAVKLMNHYCEETNDKDSDWDCKLFESSDGARNWVGLDLSA